MGSISKEIEAQFIKYVLPIFQKNAIKTFEKAKNYILKEVKNHSVCQELINKTVPSQFLDSSTSSLFGFMGFNSSDDPVGDLLIFLSENITQKVEIRITSLSLISSLSIPTKKEMSGNSKLRMPWLNGISWPEAIESGVPGFKYFIGKEGVGRSELGIQAKAKGDPEKLQQVRDRDMNPIEFLSPIFERAKEIS